MRAGDTNFHKKLMVVVLQTTTFLGSLFIPPGQTELSSCILIWEMVQKHTREEVSRIPLCGECVNQMVNSWFSFSRKLFRGQWWYKSPHKAHYRYSFLWAQNYYFNTKRMKWHSFILVFFFTGFLPSFQKSLYSIKQLRRILEDLLIQAFPQ